MYEKSLKSYFLICTSKNSKQGQKFRLIFIRITWISATDKVFHSHKNISINC